MRKFISYSGEEIAFEGCPACEYKDHIFSSKCGMAYEDELFTLSQDWELPIPGFFVVSPKKHIEKFCELTSDEKIKIFEIVDKCMLILRENNICYNYNVIFEEKPGIHFHIWIMPRHDWMDKEFGNPTKRIADVFEYAKHNFRGPKDLEYINRINEIVRSNWKNS